MQTQRIVIEWTESTTHPLDVTYFANGSMMGQGDIGFDHVLEYVRQNPGSSVVVRLRNMPVNSANPDDVLPFKRRLKELSDLASPKSITYDLF